MTNPNSNLPPPQTVGDFYAAAIVDRLDALHNLLSDRLPPLPGEPVAPVEPSAPDEPIPVKEPAPAIRPYKRKAGAR